jgi:P2 family phage contractile tail tube protein
MALAVNKVTSANIYYDGNSLLGKAESFTLTELPFVMSEHKALGALGTTQSFSAIDKIEAEMVLTSHYSDLIKKLADPTTSKQMQVRGNLQTLESTGLTAEVPLVFFLTATPMNLPIGDFKAQENATLTVKFSVTAVRCEIDGAMQFDIDLLSNKFIVDGTDILAKRNANLGV